MEAQGSEEEGSQNTLGSRVLKDARTAERGVILRHTKRVTFSVPLWGTRA